MPSPESPIAFVLGSFPQASQSFIAREIRGLRARGLSLQVFALRRRDPSVLEPPDRQWFDDVCFVPRAVAPRVIAANVAWLRRNRRRYWATFVRLVSLPHQPRVLAARAVALFLIAAWIAREIERRGGCCYIHGHFALAQTEVAMAVAGLLDRPFGFTAHARDIYATPSALPEKIRAANLVVTCTAHNMAHLRGLCPDLPENRIQLAYHGVQARQPALGDSAGPPLLFAAGRLVEKKGFDVLVRACALLRDRGVEFRACIAGDGPSRSALAKGVRDAGLQTMVDLPGWLAPDVLSARLEQSAIVVMPSRVTSGGDRDGIPNVILEAMAAARPIVAASISGIPEAVEHEATGLLVPPDQPAALADALERLARDPERRSRLGEAASVRFLERFELATSSERLAQLLLSVCAGGPPDYSGYGKVFPSSVTSSSTTGTSPRNTTNV